MGTDIHCFLEEQDINYQWHLKYELELWRNYALFGCLYDGIRGWHGFCNIPNRGIPTAISQQTLAQYSDDYHSPNYIYTSELPLVKNSFIEAIKYSYNSQTKEAENVFPLYGKGQSLDEFVFNWQSKETIDCRINNRLEQFKELFELPQSTDRLVYWFDN